MSEKASKSIQRSITHNFVNKYVSNTKSYNRQSRSKSRTPSQLELQSSASNLQTKPKLCTRCGKRAHNENMCPAKHQKCFTCHKEGHTSIVSTKSQQKRVGAIHSIGKINKSLEIELLIENQNIKFEVNTGACVTIISEEVYLWNFNHLELKRDIFNLSTVAGKQV